jgi:hypothetical protein
MICALWNTAISHMTGSGYRSFRVVAGQLFSVRDAHETLPRQSEVFDA